MLNWTWKNVDVKRLRTIVLHRGEWTSVATKVEAIQVCSPKEEVDKDAGVGIYKREVV
jgi:hypothetical protein